jgi:hypothetical protein
MKAYGLPWVTRPVIADGGYGCASVLLGVAGLYLAVGLVSYAAWIVTGNFFWVGDYFQIPGAILTVFLAGTQFWFARRALDQFSVREPMRMTWACITASAGFDLAGAVLIQILGKESVLNPLRWFGSMPAETVDALRRVGLMMGGTCRFSILALGLWFALRAYRRSRLLGRLNAVNWLGLCAMALYVVVEISEIGGILRRGKPVPFNVMMGWPVDPFLWLLLAQAMLLYRSAQQMGPGWITRCWNAMALGVFLVLLGDVVQWAASWGYISWPWSSIEWYIWPLAGVAFALAPMYQLEAILRAQGKGAFTAAESEA